MKKPPQLAVNEWKPTLRKDGRFMLWVRIAQGPKGRKPVYGQTPQECLAKAQVWRSASPLAAPTDAYPAGSFGEFYESVFVPTKEPAWAHETRRKNRSIAKVHLLPTFGQFPIALIQHENMVQYRSSLADLSPKQQRHILSHLKAVFGLAHGLGRIPANPMALIAIPKAPRKKARPEPQEGAFEKLMAAAVGKFAFLAGPIYAARRVGLRRGEVAGLMRDHLDQNVNVVRVHQQRLQCGKVTPPKGGRPRNVHVPAEVMHQLVGFVHPESAFVFSHPDGRPLSPGDISDGFPLLCEAAGLDHFDFHDLRAHFATDLAEASENPWLVAETLGHSTLSTTGIYVDGRADQQRRAIAKAVDTRGRQQKPTTGTHSD